MQLSPHFSLAELTVTHENLDNTPNPAQIAHLRVLASGLELVRKALGKPMRITSGFRSKEVNAAIGGAVNSAHLSGIAADFVVEGMTNKEICPALIKAGIKFDQVIDEDRNGSQWVHVSFDPSMRQQYLIFNNGTYEAHK